MKRKLICDVCGKGFDTLSIYSDERWAVCLHCFDKADARAVAQDRWPDARDFRALKEWLL